MPSSVHKKMLATARRQFVETHIRPMVCQYHMRKCKVSGSGTHTSEMRLSGWQVAGSRAATKAYVTQA